MNWLDWLVLIALLINVVDGFRKGFITSLFITMGFVAAIYGGVVYNPVLAAFLNDAFGLKHKIREALTLHIAIGLEASRMSIESVTRDKLMEIIDNSSIPEMLKGLFVMNMDKIQQQAFEGISTLGGFLSDFLSSMFVSALSFLIIFLFVKAVLSLVCFLLNSLTQHRSLSLINRACGMFFGAVRGTLLIMIVFALLMPIASLNTFDFWVTSLQDSLLAQYFYRYNIITPLIYKFLYGGVG